DDRIWFGEIYRRLARWCLRQRPGARCRGLFTPPHGCAACGIAGQRFGYGRRQNRKAGRERMTLAARKFFDMPPDLLTAQMEQEFFTSIMGKNKTYKTTYHDRFSEIDQLLVRQVRAGTMRASHVLDVGVSSGISTLELFKALSADGSDVNLVATDVLIDADIVGVVPGCHALIDKSGFPLMFDVFGRGVKPWITATDYKNGKFVLRKLT